MENGDAKKAERYFFDLQYHAQAQPTLFIQYANCLFAIEEGKKTPDESRKKELDMLRYGIQKLPNAGVLYLELGKRNLELNRTVEALATLETGIKQAPNFAENYYWAAKLMKATGNHLWAWIYAECCFGMTDEMELHRSSGRLAHESFKELLKPSWTADPEKMDTDLKFTLTQKCLYQGTNEIDEHAGVLKCLLLNCNSTPYSASPLFQRLSVLNSQGWLESHVTSQTQESDKEVFLKWLATHASEFEAHRSWSYWNPLQLKTAISRIEN